MPTPQLTDSDLLYQDQDLVVVNKIAGTPVHASRILADDPITLIQMSRELTGHMVFPVHRLDRPVSGATIFALNSVSQAELGQQFENKVVDKCYLAVVRGWAPENGIIEHELTPPRDERTATSRARPALTRFERIAIAEIDVAIDPYPRSRYSLVALFPVTGRRHQLRRHIKHINHPIIGDTTYGRGEHNRMFRSRFGCRRLLLHCFSLEFGQPSSGQRLRVQAPLCGQFRSVIEQLGWSAELDANFPGWCR